MMLAAPAGAELQYDAILEWDGPLFRIIGAPSINQLVDDPAGDIPFAQPLGVAAREHGTGERDVVYVADSGNNRVQVFEVNGTYRHANRSSFTWKASGITPAVLEYDHHRILPAEWKAVSDRWIIPFSDTVEIDGTAWSRVEDLSGFSAADRVYAVSYADGGNAPELLFPDNSLSESSGFVLRYALSNNQGALPDAFGLGDVDYGISAASPKVLTQIHPASGGPSSWQRVRSLALSANDADPTSDDLFLLDAADNSAGQNEELFYYTVALNGAVTYREAYDDVLTGPYDVTVARSGSSVSAGVTVSNDAGPFDQASAAVRDASQVTGHTYLVTATVGSDVTITDQTTGCVLVTAAQLSKIANPFLGIPGVSLTKNPTAGSSNVITTTCATPNRYLFVADTGGNRVKVVTAHGATPTAANDWLPGDTHVSEAQPVAAGSIGATADRDYYQTTPAVVPEDWSAWTTAFPIRQGTLATITFDPGGTPDVWTGVEDLSTRGPAEKVFSVDWTNGRILFGDGTHGAIPAANTPFGYTYTTTPDLLRFGTAGAGDGQFRSPRGIAARYNPSLDAYDVYVADSGNNRIQKLAFHPPDPDLNLPARLEFVVTWKAASSATDTLKSPVDVSVSSDASTPASVYLAVSDQGNKRMVLYRDTAAVQGGGATASVHVTSLGGTGTTLGQFQKPEGIALLPHDQALDFFVADSTRGVITKYEKAPSPEITLSFAGSSALPACFPPTSTYLFRFGTVNPPEDGWIDLYYDTSPEFNMSTSKLCITSGDIPSTASAATWVFASTPHTPAPAQAPSDNTGYYLFARMKNADGEVVAADQTTPDRLLCLDSDLVPTLRAGDAIDGDGTLSLQNGSDRVIQLQVAYPESLIAAGFAGVFDTSLVQVRGITPGEGWNETGAVSHLFNQSYSNTAGTFVVTTSAVGTPVGLNGVGPYTLARISVRCKSSALSPTRRFRNGTLSLSQSTSGMTGIDGQAPSLWQAAGINLRLGYLGDIATTGAGADGALPHLAPKPDGSIDFADQMVFTLGWNGSGNQQDRISDLGPVTGAVPELVSNPDGIWDMEDLLAFTAMFSWSNADAGRPALDGHRGPASGLLAPSVLGHELQDPGVGTLAFLVRREAAEGGEGGREIGIDLMVRGAVDLTGGWFLLEFDPNAFRVATLQEDDFLRGSDGSLFFHRTGPGWVELSASRLDRSVPGTNGLGAVAHLELTRLGRGNAPLSLAYDLRGANGDVLARGAWSEAAGVPVGLSLSPFPNPAPGQASIHFHLPASAPARLDVYEPGGRLVRSLIDAVLPPGSHEVLFDGRNGTGMRVGAGVYLIRLESGGAGVNRKLILTR